MSSTVPTALGCRFVDKFQWHAGWQGRLRGGPTHVPTGRDDRVGQSWHCRCVSQPSAAPSTHPREHLEVAAAERPEEVEVPAVKARDRARPIMLGQYHDRCICHFDLLAR